MSSISEKLTLLRDEALSELQQTKEFAAFIALDDAVSMIGGERLPIVASLDASVAAFSKIYDRIPSNLTGKRVSQGDATALVLEERGPSQIVDLLNIIPDKGGFVGGEKPAINLTSTLSKDQRFVSIRKNGNYFWWFSGRDLPEGWSGRDPLAEEDDTN